MKRRYSGTNSNDERLPFNSSIQFLERLERRFEDANESKIDGLLVTYFRSCETIFHSIIPFITKEEREAMDVLVDECKKEIRNITEFKPTIFYEDADDTIDKLYVQLMIMGVKYKLIYFQYDKKTWDEELAEDYE